MEEEINYEGLLKLFYDDAGWIKFSKKIATEKGALGAILFGYLLSQEIYWDKNRDSFKKQMGYEYSGEFFQSREQIQEQTGLTPHEQRTAEKQIEGFLVKVPKPIKNGRINFFRLNYNTIGKFFDDGSSKNLTTGHQRI